MTGRTKIDPWYAAIWLLYVLLAAAYAYLSFWRYDIFRAGVDDGTFTQIAHGFPHAFSAWSEEGANHMLVHFSPILLLAVPFVFLFDGTPGLIVMQTLGAAAVVFPLWAMAVKRFPKPAAFAVTLVAALYPPLSATGAGDFHETFLVPLLSAALVWAIDARKFRFAIAFAILLTCSKEDQFVVLSFVGVAVALGSRADREMRRCGLTIAAIAAGTAALYFGVLRPAIDPKFPYWSLHFYQWWWFPETTNGFVAWNSPERIEYLIAALTPLAFMPLFSRYAVLAIPGLAEVLLSHERISFFIGEHYSTVWIGYLLCAFVDGTSVLFMRSAIAARLALLAATCLAVWTSEYRSPLEPGFYFHRRPTLQDAANDRYLRSLPPDATIWSDDWLYAHLAMHPNASINFHAQQYLVFDRAEDAALVNDAAAVKTFMQGHAYRTIRDSGGLIVYERS